MRLIKTIVALLLFSISLSTPVFCKEFNWDLWQQIIASHSQIGKINHITSRLIDYKNLINDKRMTTLKIKLEKYDTSKLDGNLKKAFYINAYNYYAILIVLNNWPVDSIRDIGNIFFQVWDKDVGELNGQAVSLNQIEHQILRPMGDPRIHFAIVCASMSCPDLSTTIYSSKKLDAQLDKQSKIFINNNKKGLILSGNDITISAIFKWFQADFESRGGVLNFIRDYYTIPESIDNINYLPYNWQLNALH